VTTINVPNIKEKAFDLLSLAGKIALVTGAGSGIGRGIALRLAEMGATVAVLDIDEARGLETQQQISAIAGRAIFVRADVRSRSDCKRAVDQILDELKSIDILCNNAGIAIRKDVTALTEQDWDLSLDITLKSVYLLSSLVIPHMIQAGGGCVINTGSGWSLKGGPQAAAYCAAKAGVVNLTRAMAIDYGKHNIRVNCVCPGDVDTPMLQSECRQLGEDPTAFMRAAADRPLARVGTPEDVANAVLFLASPMSAWITGAALVVDGGGLA
jgi:NAD(P)-dependent dehydrogenase (short-subunit alcohol dehydrogenase family)